MSAAEYLVSMDGFPYVAGTAGASAPSSWSPAADEPRGAALLRDAIVHTRWTWSDRLRVTEGELDADGLVLELHDIKPSAGLAQGLPWLTYLSTRDALEVPSAIVEATFTAAAMSFTVSTGSASALSPAIPGVVWVDDEAILCSAINLGTGVVTVDTGGRGYYGSRARAHTVDAETGVYPEAWIAPAWATRRRVLLWRVGSDGVARVIRRLYANRAPRLSKNRASYELQCEHAWTVERGRALGVPTASTRVRGYDSHAIRFGAQVSSLFGNDTGRALQRVFDTLDQLLTWARPQLESLLVTTYTEITAARVSLRRAGTGRLVRLELHTDDAKDDSLAATITVPGETVSGAVTKTEPQASSVEKEIPAGAVMLPATNDASVLPWVPVASVVGLPSPIPTPTTQTDGPHTTTVSGTLCAKVDDKTRLVIFVETFTTDDADIGGPAVRGRYSFVDVERGRVIRPPTPASRSPVVGSPRLQLGACVSTTHWAHGLAAVIDDAAHVRAECDARNFDTDSLTTVAAGTESEAASREWVLDGETTLETLATPTLAAEGCCPAVLADGKVGFVALRHPRANEVPVATYGSGDLVGGGFEWMALPEGLVNAAQIKLTRDSVAVRDQRSVQRYGVGRSVELELQGVESTDVEDLRAIGGRALSRIVQVWGDPVAMVRWRVPVTQADTVYPGSFVTLTDLVVPNGQGGRGMTARPVQITSKGLDQTNPAMSFILLEGVCFPLCHAYSPACKVASISGAVLTCAADYVLAGGASPSDYAGLGGTDRGVSRFATGDRVKLLLRDSTTYSYLSAVVLGVNDAANTITLTASVSTSPTDWPALCASGWVDVVYDDYETSGVQAEQKLYCAGGNGNCAFGGIGASGDKSHRWAP